MWDKYLSDVGKYKYGTTMIATALFLYNGLQSNPELIYWIGLAGTALFDLVIALANNPEFTGSTDY